MHCRSRAVHHRRGLAKYRAARTQRLLTRETMKPGQGHCERGRDRAAFRQLRAVPPAMSLPAATRTWTAIGGLVLTAVIAILSFFAGNQPYDLRQQVALLDQKLQFQGQLMQKDIQKLEKGMEEIKNEVKEVKKGVEEIKNLLQSSGSKGQLSKFFGILQSKSSLKLAQADRLHFSECGVQSALHFDGCRSCC
eukprot:TRINITY_DN7612_c0_g1_i1.p1 TRINITY_DN7612_c0_g1~~TRINITY_DN7612_c0_g1_i1.p1  ORF type:complete len:220 (+),score=6.18 TRINITY_DN7612_c0_g1_i1:83-661(+)